ncbi:Head domain of trimeric autotransporter adhesin [Paracidovorax wautersii]|uniref:Head domain of trimeric autotransporter adhesin n=1 Tax=Paracidovorax wautersii TaxID=1177982 RepID=A0A1I1ZBG5_9BURK|nr:Head domain of trimeric autotransporter adhesin [Paracidovorax wautersii]
MALGDGALAETAQSVAIGKSATAKGGKAVSIGAGNVADGDGAVAIGDPNIVAGAGAVALGKDNTVNGDGAVAIGNTNNAQGQGSIALGIRSSTSSAGSVALGDTAAAKATNSMALGSGAVANNANDVALGAGSATSAAAPTASVTINGTSYNFAGASPSSVVSIGSAGNERQLKNVAAGALSAASTDAVNGSQLFATNQALSIAGGKIDALGTSAASVIGDSATYNSTTGTLAIGNNIGGTGQGTIGAAIGTANTTANTALATANKGFNVQANGDTATQVKPGDTVQFKDGQNIKVTRTGTDITVATADDLKATSIATGNAKLDTNGLAITNGPSVLASGIDAGGKKITNVANGDLSAASKDAVNGSQLFATNQAMGGLGSRVDQLGTSTAGTLGGNAAYDATTGKVTVSNVGGTGKNTVNDAIAAVQQTANTGWNVQANGDTATQVKPGDTVQFKDGKNIKVTHNGADITVATADDLNATSITTGNSKLDTNGLTIANGPSVLASGINAGLKTITNVASGAVTASSTDAVNGSQLFATGNSMRGVLGGNATYANGSLTMSNIGNTGQSTIHGAINNVNNTANNAATQATGANTTANAALSTANTAIATANLGWNIQTNGDTPSNVAPGTTVELINGQNIKVTRNGTGVTIATADDIAAISVTTGNAKLDTTGLTITNGPSVLASGIDAGGKKITNVASGDLSAASKDAVNGSQLFTTNQALNGMGSRVDQLGTSTAGTLGGNAAYDPATGNVTVSNVGGTGKDTVNDAIASVQQTANAGWNVQANGDAATQVKPGDTVQFKDGQNIKITRTGTDITVATADDLKATSITTGNAKLDTTGLTIANGPSVLASGIDAGGKTITNVTNGDLSTASKDAVNGNQLFATNTNVTNLQGDVTNLTNNVKNGTTGVVQRTTTADTTVLTAAGATSAAPGNAQKLTNLAAGTVASGSTDAVNGGQLFASNSSIAGNLGGGATVNPNGTISAPTYTIQGKNYSNVGSAFDGVNGSLTTLNTQITNINGGGGIKYFHANSSLTDSNAGGVNSIAVGPVAVATGESSMATGNKAAAIGASSTAVGDSAKASADNAMAIGAASTASGASSISMGRQSVANEVNSIAIGTQAQALWAGAVSIGGNADAMATRATAVGSQAKAFAVNSTAIGGLSRAIGERSTAIGWQAGAGGISATAMGDTARAKGDNSVAIGTSASAETAEAVSIGNNAVAKGGKSVSIGSGNTANGDGAVAIGDPNTAGTASVAMGRDNSANGNSGFSGAVALGDKNTASGLGAVALGSNNSAIGVGSVAIGADSIAGNSSVAIGSRANAGSVLSIAVGQGASASLNNSVAIGADSTTANAATRENGVTLNGNNFSFAGNTPAGVLSVGAAGAERQIKNVAAGALSATSTDGVNGSQLFATNQALTSVSTKVDTLGTSTASSIGGNASYDSTTGTLTAGTNIGGTGQTTIAGAIGSANTTANTALDTANKGWNVQANGDAATQVKPGDTVQFKDGQNIKVTRSGNDVTVATADDIDATSVTTGNAKLDTNGLTIANGPSILASGIDAGSKRIINVAAGDISTASSTDAVNGGQLFTTNQNVTNLFNSVANGAAGVVQRTTTADETVLTTMGGTAAAPGNAQKLTNLAAGTVASGSTDAVNGSQLFATSTSVANVIGGSTINADGTITGPSDIGGTGKTTVNNAIAAVNSTANKGFNVQANGDTATQVAPGATVQFKDGQNIKVTRIGSDITVATADDLTATSITTGNSKLDTNGLTITNGPSMRASGIDAGSKKITNVADGDLSATSKDAVNGSQLFATNQVVAGLGTRGDQLGTSTATVLGGNAAYDPATGKVTVSNVGGTGKDTVNDAIAAVQQTANAGWNVQANGDAATQVKPGETVQFKDGQNIKVTRTGADITVATADDLKATSITTGNVKLDTNGLAITNGPSVLASGIDAGDKTITNVANGDLSAASKDAVTGSQLFTTNQAITGLGARGDQLGTSTATVLGGNAAYDSTTGKVGMSNVGGTGKDTVNDAIASVQQTANAGWNVQANGDAATQVQPGSTVQFKDGQNIKVTRTGTDITVATADDLKATSITTGNAKLDTNGLAIANGPSVLASGIDAGDKKITNVANGDLSAASKDAVNGNQLFATNQAITGLGGRSDQLGSSTASTLGGNAAYDATTGRVTVSNVGGTGKDTVNDAIASVQQTANAGWNVQANGDAATQVKPGDTVQFKDGQNIKVTRTGTDITVATADDLKATSITTGNAKLDTNGLAIANGPSVLASGIDAGGKKITNVANGDLSAASKDAVTGSQLFATNQAITGLGGRSDQLGSSTASTLGGNAAYDATTGKVTVSNVGGTGKDTVNDAIASVQQTANAGWNVQANGDAATQVKPGDTVQFKYGQNIKITRTGTDITVATADDLKATSITTGNVKLDTTGLTITNGPSVLASGIDAGDKKITNVANGDLSAASKDAVNGSQLFTTNQTVNDVASNTSQYLGGGADVKNGKAPSYSIGGSIYNNVGDVFSAIDGGSSGVVQRTSTLDETVLTAKGGTAANPGNAQRLTNLAAGAVSSSSTDAVNGSQLFAVDQKAGAGWNISAQGSNSTNVAPGATVDLKNSDGNIVVRKTASGNDVTFDLSKVLTLDSLTMGNTFIDTAGVKVGSDVVLGSTGLVIANGPSVTRAGVDAGGMRIVNVAAGSAATDAVNVSQLQAAVSSGRTRYYGANDGGTQGGNSNGDGATGSQALAAGVGATASGAGASAVGAAASASGAGAVALGRNASARADGSVAVGDGASDGGRGAERYTGTYSGVQNDTAGTVSIGNASAGQIRTLSNVADAREATDAVNLRQLDGAVRQANVYTDSRVQQVSQQTVQNTTNVQNLRDGKDGLFQVNNTDGKAKPSATGSNAAAGGSGAVASGDRSLALGTDAQATANNAVALGSGAVADRANSVSVGAAGRERQVTNVAAGSADTDAVNVSQLRSSQQGMVRYDTNPDGTSNYSRITMGNGQGPATISNVAPGVAGTDAVNVDQLNQGLAEQRAYTDRAVNTVRREANAGIAAAIATANLPQAYAPGRGMTSVAIGTYGGQSALAVGASVLSDSGRWIFKFSGSATTRGSVGVGGGVGFAW